VRQSGRIHYQEYLKMASTTIKEQSRHFPAGTVIFREGDPSDFFYLITSGRVRKITRGQENFAHAKWLASDEELVAGDYFGTSAILGSGERKRHSTMVAVTDVQVVALGSDDFDAADLRAHRSSAEGRSIDSDAAAHASSMSVGAAGGSGAGGSAAVGSSAAGTGGSEGGGAVAGGGAEAGSGAGGNLTKKLLPPRSHASPHPGRISTARSLRFIYMMSNNEQRRYPHGAVLFREGDEADHMYIIKAGSVQVSCDGRDGRKHTIGRRGAGECCGETSCLSHKPRNTTVTCISPVGCDVLCVSRDDFIALVRGSWDVAKDLVALSERHSKEKERRVNFMRTRDEVSGDEDDTRDEDELHVHVRPQR